MNTAIIVAAGDSSRMGSSQNKQFMGLAGKPVLAHCLLTFNEADFIDAIVVVAKETELAILREDIVESFGVSKVIDYAIGGRTRQDSVFNGLQKLPSETTAVLIHDGARPLVTEELARKVLAPLSDYDGAVLGIPAHDTVKRASEHGVVENTLDRQKLWLIQTPQAFHPSILVRSYQQARMDGFLGTDDSALVERIGGVIKIELGSMENIKITNPEDLIIAEAILNWRKMLKE